MAIIKCSECGGDVSDSANFCPHCGSPSKQMEQFQKLQESNALMKNRKNSIGISLLVGVWVFIICRLFGMHFYNSCTVGGIFVLICLLVIPAVTEHRIKNGKTAWHK